MLITEIVVPGRTKPAPRLRVGSLVIDKYHFELALYGRETVPTLHVFVGFHYDHVARAEINLKTLKVMSVLPERNEGLYRRKFHDRIVEFLQEQGTLLEEPMVRKDELMVLWKRINIADERPHRQTQRSGRQLAAVGLRK